MNEYINEKLCAYTDFLKGKHCAVLGVGISNIPLIKFLLENGAKVTARDKKSIEALSENHELDIPSLKASGVEFVTGEGYLENLFGFLLPAKRNLLGNQLGDCNGKPCSGYNKEPVINCL